MDKETRVKIDMIRNLIGKLNRNPMPNTMNMHSKAEEMLLSPPYKGYDERVATRTYEYPKQLSGLHNFHMKQRVRITGNTSGQSQFGGISGASYGMPTGGSYRT